MKRSIFLYLLLAAIIVFAVIKIFRDRHKSQSLKSVTAVQSLPADGYIVRDTLVNYQLSSIGTLLANESVDIQSEISQRLISINFQEGSFIPKGTLLFKLDDATYQAELEKLTIKEELAAENEKRSRALLDKGGISQQVYDEVLNQLKTIRADIDLLRVQIDKTEIRAPFGGKIGLRNVSEGAFIKPEDVLATLEDVTRIKLDFDIPEQYSMSIKKGQTVTFTIQGCADIFTATIEATQPGVDVSTRNLHIRAVTENKDGRLIPGTSAKVLLDFPETEQSLFIPSQCLIPTQQGYQVYQLKQGKVVMNIVTTGIRNKESVQILEGALAGDTLIMTNLLRIKPGDKVKIIKTY